METWYQKSFNFQIKNSIIWERPKSNFQIFLYAILEIKNILEVLIQIIFLFKKLRLYHDGLGESFVYIQSL